jgi:D-sedoheptulose 7-phosphate isomerase
MEMMNYINLEKTISSYFLREIEILRSISYKEVLNLYHLISSVRKSNNCVYIAGNGGSAATASHFATDIGTGSLSRKNPIKAISLNDNSSVITATSNDISFDLVFANQIKLLASPGDLLILISASGNSVNLLRAFHQAKEVGVNVFSLTGFDGGELRRVTVGSNIHVSTKIGEYGVVEDLHLAICHTLTECLRSNDE